MSTLPEKVIRVLAPFGTLASLLRNRDKVAAGSAGKLAANDLTVVTGRGICRQWTLVAGLPVDHGEVADEAAMLSLHVDSAETPKPRWVAPGDSCTRADDPGWRWHCIAGNGTTLADWERRPLEGALSGLSVSGHTHAISAITGLQTALDGKQDELTNILALNRITAVAGGPLLWDGSSLGGSGGGGTSTPIRRLQLTNTGYLTWAYSTDFWTGSGGAFTIVAKVLAAPTPTSVWPTIARIGGFGGQGNAIMFRVRRDLSPVCIQFYCAVSGTLYNCRTTSAFAFGYQYHTIIGTSDGTPTGLKVYVDGVAQSVAISNDGATTPGAPSLYVGGDANGNAGWLGFIDELAIAVGQTWSAEEVAAYQTSRAFPVDPTWELSLDDWPHAKVSGAAGDPTGFGSGLLIV